LYVPNWVLEMKFMGLCEVWFCACWDYSDVVLVGLCLDTILWYVDSHTYNFVGFVWFTHVGLREMKEEEKEHNFEIDHFLDTQRKTQSNSWIGRRRSDRGNEGIGNDVGVKKKTT